MKRLAPIALLAAVVLSGCGEDVTADGLVGALNSADLGIDPDVSPERYLNAVEGMCDSHESDDGISINVLEALARDEKAFQRMVAGMNYVCDGGGDSMSRIAEALGISVP